MLMVTDKVGRPAQPGPRYPSGRRKPEGDPRGRLIWRTLKENGLKLGADPRTRTQLSLLGLTGELTDSQVEAGFKFAGVYGRYERLKRLPRRSAASPSYMRAFGDPDGDDDPIDPIALEKLERRIRRAAEQFDAVQKLFKELPAGAQAQLRALVESVCIEDRPPGTMVLPELRALLDRIAEHFKIPIAHAENAIAITANRPRRTPDKNHRPRAQHQRPGEINSDPFLAVMGKLRPDLTENELRLALHTAQALKARQRFRREKERRR